MPKLDGAVAYREDAMGQYAEEIGSWALAKRFAYPIACPKGGACDKTYLLLSGIGARDTAVTEQVGRVLDAMEHEECSEHRPRIRIEP